MKPKLGAVASLVLLLVVAPGCANEPPDPTEQSASTVPASDATQDTDSDCPIADVSPISAFTSASGEVTSEESEEFIQCDQDYEGADLTDLTAVYQRDLGITPADPQPAMRIRLTYAPTQSDIMQFIEGLGEMERPTGPSGHQISMNVVNRGDLLYRRIGATQLSDGGLLWLEVASVTGDDAGVDRIIVEQLDRIAEELN